MFRMWRSIRLFIIRSLIILCSECGDLLDCSVCGVLSYYVQNVKSYETVQYAKPYHNMFRMSHIILCSVCGDLLDCSVCGVLSYYVQNVKSFETSVCGALSWYVQNDSYQTMFRMWRSIRLFSMRSLIILCSERGDLLDCSVCWALS
jgi:hypothetical protein